MLKWKVTNRQRKHLLGAEAIHSDAERALQTLLNIALQIDGNDEQLDEGEIEEAQAQEAAAIGLLKTFSVLKMTKMTKMPM